jgi:nicotinamidase-related amidase
MHESLTILPTKLALLLVDVQEEHRRDVRFLAEDYDAAVRNCAKLLVAARASTCAVVHARYVRDFAVEPARHFEVLGEGGAPSFSDAASELISICPEVSPQTGEHIITKHDASVFRNTALRSLLSTTGIEWLVIAGAWTEACVAATVRDAIAQGFRVLLVKDACASGTRHMHQVGILNLANRLLGGAVCATASAAAILSGQAAQVWRFSTMVPFRYTADTVASLYESL